MIPIPVKFVRLTVVSFSLCHMQFWHKAVLEYAFIMPFCKNETMETMLGEKKCFSTFFYRHKKAYSCVIFSLPHAVLTWSSLGVCIYNAFLQEWNYGNICLGTKKCTCTFFYRHVLSSIVTLKCVEPAGCVCCGISPFTILCLCLFNPELLYMYTCIIQCIIVLTFNCRYAWRESPCVFKQCAVYSQTTDLPGPPFITVKPDSAGKAFSYTIDWSSPQPMPN
jgi:hypothetical protein